MTTSLEPGPDEMRRLVELATARIVEHIDTLEAQGPGDLGRGREFAPSLDEPLPEQGSGYEEILALLFDRVIPASLNSASPGHMSYVPNGGLFHAAVADLIVAATNRYVTYWAAAPGLAQLELNVVRWVCELIGWGDGSGGVLTSGGSIANLMALVTARRNRLPPNFLSGTIYTSDQAHHSVRKAAVIAGFEPERVREVPSDEQFRLVPSALRQQVERDRNDGLQPFIVVGTAGTTSTGAVDDLHALADLSEELGLWFHVDAAYGGFFLLTERGRRALSGIERADSVVLDPHKSLFLPFGTGSLLVRDVETLRMAHLVHSEYLAAAVDTGRAAGATNFADLSPELSRACRGLRVWLPLKLLGAAAFRESLDEKLDLARRAHAALSRMPEVELLAEARLSTVAFRVLPRDGEQAHSDELNQRIIAAVNRRGRVHLSGTTLRGLFAIRICVLSFRSHLRHVEACLEDLRAAIDEVR